jgi:hypothetical protein
MGHSRGLATQGWVDRRRNRPTGGSGRQRRRAAMGAAGDARQPHLAELGKRDDPQRARESATVGSRRVAHGWVTFGAKWPMDGSIGVRNDPPVGRRRRGGSPPPNLAPT